MTPICLWYLKGICNYGEECKRWHPLHVDVPMPGYICRHFLEGRCAFSDCYKLHPDIPREACAAFKRTGDCHFGDTCRFLHEERDEEPSSAASVAAPAVPSGPAQTAAQKRRRRKEKLAAARLNGTAR